MNRSDAYPATATRAQSLGRDRWEDDEAFKDVVLMGRMVGLSEVEKVESGGKGNRATKFESFRISKLGAKNRGITPIKKSGEQD